MVVFETRNAIFIAVVKLALLFPLENQTARGLLSIFKMKVIERNKV